MRVYFYLLLLLCPGVSLRAQVLIQNVQVLDVEKKKILPGYNVVALDGKIVSVDKGRTYKLPEGTRVIDGTGKYLIPGLADAHIHFFQSGGIYARPDAIDLRRIRPYQEEIRWVHEHMEQFLRMYSRAGITSVIDVGSTLNFLRQRDTFASKPYAPRVMMTGPLLTTYIPPVFLNLGDDSPFLMMTAADSVRMQVRNLKAMKADFVKIWYIVQDKDIEKGAKLNLPLVSAAIDEAHKLNLPVAVHATEMITAKLAVEAGADFLVHNVDDQVVTKEFVALLSKKKTVLCPTMVVAHNYTKVFSHNYQFAAGELEITHPATAATIIDFPQPDTTLGKRMLTWAGSDKVKENDSRMDSVMVVNLRILSDAGVIIATGTDAGNTGTQHVGSYFTELAAMQQAGMNNWQILASSTINAARAVGRQNEWGSIAKGKQADMVLLNANPIDSLSSLRQVNLVISRGQVLEPDSLVTFSPAELAQQQLNAYNAHDLEAFLAPYAEDVEIYTFPDKLDVKGKDKMREEYGFIRKFPNLYCRLLNRIVQGNIVIDHEEILGVPGSPHYGVAIYVIENGKISKAYFPGK